ncbi:hypothetical protein ABH925_006833, partial [Streptacidiphilus sp. EB129]
HPRFSRPRAGPQGPGKTTNAEATTPRCGCSTNPYPTGITIGDTQMAALPLDRHHWHGDWNYTLRPENHCRDGIPPIPPQDLPGPGRSWLPTRP